MKVITDLKKIEGVLTRGTQDIFVLEHLKEALLSGKELRIKLGIDPTGPAIHLGRAVVLRKLRAFQELGHKVVLIIGDFTAKIGDPSDKLEKRPMLTEDQIKKNLEGYLDQIGKIIDLSKTEIKYNSEWLGKMNFIELGQLMECFTVQQMVKRRNFKERIDAGEDVFMVEFLYPALQGYDSIAVSSDVELGGFDQLFNLKAGRTVQKRYGQKEQDIMTVTMLEGTDGRKMSSSWGNVISLLDSNYTMYNQLMKVNDDLIIKYFSLCTDLSIEDISNLEKELEKGVNPRNIKMRLAKEIVRMYHGEEMAEEAEQNFINISQNGAIPANIQEVEGNTQNLVDILLNIKYVSSKTDFRHLVDEGAITNIETKEKVTDYKLKPENGQSFKVGNRGSVKVVK